MHQPSVIPQPFSITPTGEGFLLSRDTAIVASGAAVGTADYLATALSIPTGFAFPIVPQPVYGAICLELDRTVLGAEQYRLIAATGMLRIIAGTLHGLFNGVQTLLQLLPPEILGRQPANDVEWVLPGVIIEDEPRFAWRDVMLDCSRHFWSTDFIRRLLDLMALHKFNRFHWHLTDDQGWRLEIRRYPRLTEIGAWRRRSQTNHKRDEPPLFDDQPIGGFYTQDDVRAVIQYAAERHIEVVPEIDMPGHMQSAVAAYPELGDGSGVAVSDNWLISPHVLHPSESTISFMQDVLTEVIDLFPGRYIHVGGDECDKSQWRQSAHAQELIAKLRLGDEDGLQSWFVGRISDFLTRRGRTLVGWDEILEGGLVHGAVVMSWRGMKGGIEAARAGHSVIMTPQRSVYLDNYQTADFASEPLASRFNTELEVVYAFEPVPAELSQDQQRCILGTGAKLWTEYVSTEKHAEYMLFPRLCALSEVAWSPRAARHYNDFHRRLRRHEARLAALGVRGRPLDALIRQLG